MCSTCINLCNAYKHADVMVSGFVHVVRSMFWLTHPVSAFKSRIKLQGHGEVRIWAVTWNKTKCLVCVDDHLVKLVSIKVYWFRVHYPVRKSPTVRLRRTRHHSGSCKCSGKRSLETSTSAAGSSSNQMEIKGPVHCLLAA